MKKVEDIVASLRREWSEPRQAVHFGEPVPFLLSCSFARGPASLPLDATLPLDLRDLWATITSATLFEDAEFGQWGLALLSPQDSRSTTEMLKADRPREYRDGDMVVGRFLGDSDLLIVRCDPTTSDFGSVMVALPTDARADWYRPARALNLFLETYVAGEGAKYWERRSALPVRS